MGIPTKVEGLMRADDSDAPLSGSSLKGYLTASFRQLADLFGEPSSCGDRVSTRWIAVWKGTFFHIYEYKDTALYDPDYPSVEEFRAMPTYGWHIGAHRKEDADAFIAFMKEIL